MILFIIKQKVDFLQVKLKNMIMVNQNSALKELIRIDQQQANNFIV